MRQQVRALLSLNLQKQHVKLNPLSTRCKGRLLQISSLLLLLTLTASCVSLRFKESKGKAYPLPGSYDEVWDATLKALQEEKIPVEIADKEKGYIQSKTFPLYEKEYEEWAKKPPLVDPGFCLVEIGIVKQTPTMTMVGVKAYFKRKSGLNPTGYRKNDPSRGVLEALLSNRINNLLIKTKYPQLNNVIVGCSFVYDDKTKHYIIADVVPGKLAYEQGLRNGDLLMKIDNQPIDPSNLFQLLINKPGETVRTFTVMRGKELHNLPISIFYLNPGAPKVGMSVKRDDVTKKFKVVSVRPDTPAAESDIRTGDFLIQENDVPLSNNKNYYRALVAERAGQPLVFTVERNGQTLTREVIPVKKANGSSFTSLVK